MEISYTKRMAFNIMMILSAAAGITFFCTNHIDLISAMIQYNKLNIPNIAYVLMQIVLYVFIPILFLVPSVFPYARIRLTKIGFMVYGVCHLLMPTWIIYFLSAGNGASIADNSAVINFLTEGKFIYFPTYWDTYGWSATFFAIATGILCIKIGIDFDDNKEIVKGLLVSLICIYILLPLIDNLFANSRIFSLYWITNNFLTLTSLTFFLIGIVVAATHDYSWIEFVWDQSVATEDNNSDDEDLLE